MMGRLHLLYRRNRLPITPWLTAPYTTTRSRTRRVYDDEALLVLDKSQRLAKHLLANGKLDENRVVSPLSIQLVLRLRRFHQPSASHLLRHRFRRLSQFRGLSDLLVGPRVRCSNALWIDQSLTLKPSFKQILDSDYRAALNPLDFHTKAADEVQGINSWVENETSGVVKDLIGEGSLNKSVRLVFANDAIYFKGSWSEEPNPVLRSYDESEILVMAPVMTSKNKEFGRFYHHNISLLDQPHKKESEEEKRNFSLHFYYPLADTEHGLRSHFNSKTLMEVGGHMTPKFNISSEMEASNLLRGLGITSPFSGGGLMKMLSCSSSDGRVICFKHISKGIDARK